MYTCITGTQWCGSRELREGQERGMDSLGGGESGSTDRYADHSDCIGGKNNLTQYEQ